MIKFSNIFLLVLFISYQVNAQSKQNRWVVGAGFGVAKLLSADPILSGEQFNFQAPKLNATRYFFYGLSLDASVEISSSYLTVDGGVRYDFGTSNKNFVPYLVLGSSFVKVPETSALTLNVGGGGTFWLSNRFGLNGQVTYKNSSSKSLLLRSHNYFSLGVIYSLEPRSFVTRLWDRNN